MFNSSTSGSDISDMSIDAEPSDGLLGGLSDRSCPKSSSNYIGKNALL